MNEDLSKKREEILQEIQRVAAAIEPNPLTRIIFKRESRISEGRVRYYFGSWNEAVKAAGLPSTKPGSHASGYSKVNDELLLEEIGRLWRQRGKPPTENSMSSAGKFSVKPYRTRWGTFGDAVAEYQRLYGVPSCEVRSENETEEFDRSIQRSSNNRPIVVPPTHKPKDIANRHRILYGEPLDFRGLRYAPINEQGVVYLFGMVSRELGFLIESVRTDYPDCEGKRSLDSSGHKWQHIRIEFEYRSKNFVEHGHNPDECELIVCWIHDWMECPIEVLELRSAIRLLPSK